MSAASRKTPSWASLTAEIGERLAANKRVRRVLPGRGRLHVDRQLPFLVVHRQGAGDEDDGGARLAQTTGSYLLAPTRPVSHVGARGLLREVVTRGAEAFGGFLLLELWTRPAQTPLDDADGAPAFTVHTPRALRDDDAVTTLVDALERVKVHRKRARVSWAAAARPTPPGLPAWLTTRQARELGCVTLGLEVESVWMDAEGGQDYPLVMRSLLRQVSRALHRTFHAFACDRTRQCPVHYHALGRRAMVRAAWEVDGQLASVSKAFDFLLLCTPVNVEPAWRSFQRKGQAPVFRYRPIPVDPVLLKRKLFEAPLERIEDPALDRLFREKQIEIDRQLTLLLDRGTRRFLPGSRALYGGVGRDLLEMATALLETVPRASDAGRARGLGSQAVARHARAELAVYRKMRPSLKADVVVRDDYPPGLIVSSGKLLVGAGTRLSPGRLDALLQHEVGTHIVTYENGLAQPLQLLAAGLAGYEELQEGLAVLAEYLVGGLTAGRLRVLAARVVAAAALLDGADFVEVHRRLSQDHDFESRTAFGITMRVFRAGGLVKDAIYLRGLQAALDYVCDGNDLEPLLVGKIAVGHVGIVEELRHRRVLEAPPLRPLYLDREDVVARLQDLRAGTTVADLLPKGEP